MNIDPRFPAAHYQDGRDLTPPCLWVADLDDILSASGQLAVAAIRSKCDCPECTSMREVFVVGEQE